MPDSMHLIKIGVSPESVYAYLETGTGAPAPDVDFARVIRPGGTAHDVARHSRPLARRGTST